MNIENLERRTKGEEGGRREGIGSPSSSVGGSAARRARAVPLWQSQIHSTLTSTASSSSSNSTPR